MENKRLFLNDFLITLQLDKLVGGWYAICTIYDQNDGKADMSLFTRRSVWHKKLPDGWGVTKAEARKSLTRLKKESMARIKHNDFNGNFLKYT